MRLHKLASGVLSRSIRLDSSCILFIGRRLCDFCGLVIDLCFLSLCRLHQLLCLCKLDKGLSLSLICRRNTRNKLDRTLAGRLKLACLKLDFASGILYLAFGFGLCGGNNVFGFLLCLVDTCLVSD